MKRLASILLSFISAIIFICNQVHARDVTGVIVNDTWRTNEQINVKGDLAIGKLVIQPGVDVFIDGNYAIIVNGTLSAVGTANNLIIIEPLDSQIGWKGFKFENAPSGSKLKYCHIKGVRNSSALTILESHPVIEDCIFEDNRSNASGGAISLIIDNGDLMVENCFFIKNSSMLYGGAIYAVMQNGEISLKKNNFLSNTAGNDSCQQDTAGGAVFVRGNSSLKSNYFKGNRVKAYTIYAKYGRSTKGGALYTETGLCEVIGNGFINNGCTMNAHKYTPDASYPWGGAIYQHSGQLILRNNILAKNLLTALRYADYRGSAIFIAQSENTVMENDTFVNNLYAPAIYISSSVPVENVKLINSIVYFNFDSGKQIEGLLTSSYSDIQGGYSAGSSILNVNPVLDDFYQVLGVSPLVDAGNPNSIYNDAYRPMAFGSLRNDIGFLGGPYSYDCQDFDDDGVADCIDECWGNSEKALPGQCGCDVSDTDTDKDGTADCNDDCPNDAAKLVPGVCGCGVADTDTDKDKTLDCNDGCPTDPKKIVPGICGCGKTDTDTDKDGTADCNDDCPTDAAKLVPGICGCGKVDTDTDGDSIADCNDKCPTDKNKIDPGACGCGNIDTDTDGDGTADCNDKCPTDKNKIDPGACGCGKVDADTDKDRTPDCNDGCPTDPKKIVPGICGCGVADTDTDKDGIPDCNDDCDSSKDTDNDGINNCDDKCPLDKNNDLDGDGVCYPADFCPENSARIARGSFGCGNLQKSQSISAGAPQEQTIEVKNEDSLINGLKLLVPAGGVKTDRIINIGTLDNFPAFSSNVKIISEVVEIYSIVENLEKPAMLSIPYTDEDLSVANIEPNDLEAFILDGGKWKSHQPESVDTDKKVINFKITFLSVYAIGKTFPRQVVPPNPPVQSESGDDDSGPCFIGTINW